jgi:hypothetical protein
VVAQKLKEDVAIKKNRTFRFLMGFFATYLIRFLIFQVVYFGNCAKYIPRENYNEFAHWLKISVTSVDHKSIFISIFTEKDKANFQKN